MSQRYYQQQLQNLRELAREFSRLHPAAAPMLGSQSADPDVERLLEAVAFLTGMLRRKMDDSLPEIIHGLMDVVLPHYLRPIPATSIVVFTPKPSMMESIQVPAGTSIRSVALDDTDCVFQTCFDLEVHPLQLVEARVARRVGSTPQIRLTLELKGPTLSQWQPSRLCFFLGGGYAQAADLYCLLTRQVEKIELVPASGGSPCRLTPRMLKPIGFERGNSLFPYPARSFSGYRLLQEYFVLPRKFLFLDLVGWDRWQDRGDGSRFEIVFHLSPQAKAPQQVSAEQFRLFATPVVNLFKMEADPVTFDHHRERVRVVPAADKPGSIEIYSIDKVTGFSEGSVERNRYSPINLFSPSQPGTCYQVIRRVSPVSGRPEVFLAFSYDPDARQPATETLSIELTCTNGRLPERLQLGEICRPTYDSPELLAFENIIPATAPVDPALEGKELWSFLSHLSLNLLSLMDLEGLRQLLRLYVFPNGRDRVKITANLKRVAGITAVASQPADTLVRGFLVRGQQINLEARQDHFACTGDLFLFGSILNHFFSQYSNINSFTRLVIKESLTGETFTWQEMVGARPLT